MSQARTVISHFLSHYSMVFVLLLLCVICSLATLGEQHPAGAKAARILAKELAAEPGPNADILIVAKENEEDLRFARTLENLLAEKNFKQVTFVGGEPVAVRKALEALAEKNQPVDLIATTQNYAPSVESVRSRVSAYSQAPVRTPSSYVWPTFLLKTNLLNVANQIVVIAIIAVGMTMVIVTAGIDLSVGSLIALSAVIVAWLITRAGGVEATPIAMIACSFGAILACGLVGAFSGVMITKFRLPPFIATLAMMQVASGLAYIISKGKPIYQIPDSFVWLGHGTFLSIPRAVLLMAAIYVAGHVLMSKTALGRYIYAVGGNREAARLSGVRVDWVLLMVYTTSGLMAGLGGVVMASQLKTGAPTYGGMYELYVIAAVVVGGTSLAGGEGRVMGTLIGAFIIAVIWNGMNLTNVESYTQKVVLGLVILVAVLLDMMKKRGGFNLDRFFKFLRMLQKPSE